MKTRQRSVAAATVSAFAAALLAVTAQPSVAAPNTPASTAPTSNDSANHTMGSQIRKHEGNARQPNSAAQLNSADFQLDAGIYGIDVASYQGNVDWAAQYRAGKRFVWTKATEGTGYTNPYFSQQYDGSYNAGFIRGAYHFAQPASSSGAAQANYFVAHGGGWSADGKTLPGALDMEYNPSGSTCYGLSKAAMTSWIKDFSDTYHAKTTKWPTIYTSTSWWGQCVSGDFSHTNALWVARYASSVGALPASWGQYTVWQYSSTPIDQDVFNGSAAQLSAFAKNHD